MTTTATTTTSVTRFPAAAAAVTLTAATTTNAAALEDVVPYNFGYRAVQDDKANVIITASLPDLKIMTVGETGGGYGMELINERIDPKDVGRWWHCSGITDRQTVMAPTGIGKSFSDGLKEVLQLPLIEALPALSEQNTLIIDEDDTIEPFLNALYNQGLRSCVVRHRARRSCLFSCLPSKVSYSFSDVRDFSYQLMRVHRLNRSKSFSEILEDIKKEKIGSIANVSKRAPFVRHDVTDTVSHVCAAFKPCCRVPLFNQNTLVRVMSPADFLTILHKYDVVKEIEKAEEFSVKENAKKPVMTLMESESLLKAMVLMERHGYSALPIVSEGHDDNVLGVISVRDIKYLVLAQDGGRHPENLLNEPALKFIEYVRQQGLVRHEPYEFLPESASLQDMVEVFLGPRLNNTHTVYRLVLTDARGRMTGMVTLTDVMRNLADVLGQFRRVPSSEQLPPSHPAHNRN